MQTWYFILPQRNAETHFETDHLLQVLIESYKTNKNKLHLLNLRLMELDLQSLFRLHVHSFTHWVRPRNPLPPTLPHLGSDTVRGRYWSANIDVVSL